MYLLLLQNVTTDTENKKNHSANVCILKQKKRIRKL